MKAAFANAALRIELDGAVLDPSLARTATGVVVRQRLSAPSVAEVAFAEPSADVIAVLKFGAALRLALVSGTLFSGEITAIEHCRDGDEGAIVRVRAFDRLHRLRKKQRARTLSNVSIGQLVADTVREIGLGCEAASNGPTHRLIAQYEESDFDLLVGLAAEAGLYLYLDGDTVRLVSLAGAGEPLELRVGRDLAMVRASANAESMRVRTETKGWDVLRTQLISGSATLARQDANDMRAIDLSAFSGLGERTLFNRIAGAADQAEALAQADLDRSAAREVVVEATAEGNPHLRPGRLVAIVGLGATADGVYSVSEAVHSFTEASGYLTEFSTAPPQLSQMRSRAPVLSVGTVSDLGDPDRLSRVKARLKLCGDLETDWMPVVIPGAGADKGLAVIPEVGDDVLIVFPQGDLAAGIVLGGLYGESRAPGLVEAGVRPFTFRTGNGQAIILDAAGGLARIETSGGDVFEMGPKGARMHAVEDLVIEAPGRTLTIRAKAVEFEQG